MAKKNHSILIIVEEHLTKIYTCKGSGSKFSLCHFKGQARRLGGDVSNRLSLELKHFFLCTELAQNVMGTIEKYFCAAEIFQSSYLLATIFRDLG